MRAICKQVSILVCMCKSFDYDKCREQLWCLARDRFDCSRLINRSEAELEFMRFLFPIVWPVSEVIELVLLRTRGLSFRRSLDKFHRRHPDQSKVAVLFAFT